MPVRLVISMQAKPGRGAELLEEMERRCALARAEPGCEQFEIFQSARDPDTLCLLELWADQAALDVHAAGNAAAPPSQRMAELRVDGAFAREDYEHNRTR
jgi:quinol monooxygenase YgiN